MPGVPDAEAYLDACIAGRSSGTGGRTRKPTEIRRHSWDVLRMIDRRAKPAGLDDYACCSTFRARALPLRRERRHDREPSQIAAHELPADNEAVISEQ